MPHIPKQLGNPPPIGTPLDSPEWKEWSTVYARWYPDVLGTWALGAFQPLPNPPRGSVPSVRRHD